MRFRKIKKKLKGCPSEPAKPIEPNSEKQHPWNKEVRYSKELPPKEHKKS